MDKKQKVFADGTDETTADKRKSDRKKLIVDVQFEGGDTTGIASTRNISLGGLFIKTRTYLEEDTPLLMRMTLGGREIILRGVVVFADSGEGVGVQFRNLSDEARELILKVIDAD